MLRISLTHYTGSLPFVGGTVLTVVLRMYQGTLVVEGTCHTYHVSEENALNPQAVGTGNGLFEIINALHPDGYEMPPEKWFKDDTARELADLMWPETDIDFARFMSTKLTDYFADGMNRLDTGVELRKEYGDFRVPTVIGSVNPPADDAVAQLREEQDERPEPWASIEPTGASELMERPKAGRKATSGD